MVQIKFISIILTTLIVIGCSKQQQVIFEAHSIKYKNRDSYITHQIEEACVKISDDLKARIDGGWRVVTSSAKEKLVVDNRGTCVGTEYVLEK